MEDEPFKKALAEVPGLQALAKEFVQHDEENDLYVTMELVLEGLHQHSLLAKEEATSGVSYSDMLGIMLESLDDA